jgi:predicted transcriptional regulator
MHRDELTRELTDRLTRVHGVRIVRRNDLGDNVLHRFDPQTRTLEAGGHLSSGQYVFKLAAELGFLEFGDLIDKLVDEASSPATSPHPGPAGPGQLLRRRDRVALTAVPRRGRQLPLRRGAAVGVLRGLLRNDRAPALDAAATRHARRPTVLRPVDRAGNMSKRQSATGFHFSSSGGTCPLWNVYETFANPGKILVQIAQMPDGRNYMWVARTVERRGGAVRSAG